MLPLPLPPHAAPLLLVRVAGHPQDVAHRTPAMAQSCRDMGAITVIHADNAVEAARLWQARRAISPATVKVRPNKVAEDVAVPLGAIPALVDGVQEISKERRLPILCFGHAGDGNIHVNIMFDQRDPQEREAAPQAVVDLFHLVRRLAGTLSGEHGVGLAKAPYLGMELSPEMVGLQRRLKQVFDPLNIMNPGKIFPPA